MSQKVHQGKRRKTPKKAKKKLAETSGTRHRSSRCSVSMIPLTKNVSIDVGVKEKRAEKSIRENDGETTPGRDVERLGVADRSGRPKPGKLGKNRNSVKKPPGSTLHRTGSQRRVPHFMTVITGVIFCFFFFFFRLPSRLRTARSRVGSSSLLFPFCSSSSFFILWFRPSLLSCFFFI